MKTLNSEVRRAEKLLAHVEAPQDVPVLILVCNGCGQEWDVHDAGPYGYNCDCNRIERNY